MTKVLTLCHRSHLFFLIKIPVPFFFRSVELEEISGPLNSVPLQSQATLSYNLLHKHTSFAALNVWSTNYVLICYQCFSLISVLCSIHQLTRHITFTDLNTDTLQNNLSSSSQICCFILFHLSSCIVIIFSLYWILFLFVCCFKVIVIIY